MTGKFNFCKSHSNSFYTLLNMLAMWIHVNRSHSSPMERVLQKSKILVTFLVLPKILIRASITQNSQLSHFQFKVTGKIKILVTFLVLPKILNLSHSQFKVTGKIKILVTFLVLPKILNSSHSQFKVTGKINFCKSRSNLCIQFGNHVVTSNSLHSHQIDLNRKS